MQRQTSSSVGYIWFLLSEDGSTLAYYYENTTTNTPPRAHATGAEEGALRHATIRQHHLHFETQTSPLTVLQGRHTLYLNTFHITRIQFRVPFSRSLTPGDYREIFERRFQGKQQQLLRKIYIYHFYCPQRKASSHSTTKTLVPTHGPHAPATCHAPATRRHLRRKQHITLLYVSKLKQHT